MEQITVEVGIDDIIEYEQDGALLTGIVVSLEMDSDDYIRVFEWPVGIEVPGEDLSVRLTDVHLEDIVDVKLHVADVIEDEVLH